MKKLLFIFGWIILAQAAWAGNETFNNIIQPNSGTVMQVLDDKWSTMTTQADPNLWGFTNYKTKAYVKLSVNETSEQILAYGTYSAKLKISWYTYDYTNQNMIYHQETVDMQLDHQLAQDTKEVDAIYYIDGAHNITVTVLQTNGEMADLRLEGEIQVERYYTFLASEAISTMTIDASSTPGIINVNWPQTYGGHEYNAEYYDLEWTFINDYSEVSGVYVSAANLKIGDIFRNNATRVSVKENHYTIENIYPHGHLLFRLRAVGAKVENEKVHYVEGAWSPHLYNTVQDFQTGSGAFTVHNNTAPFENDKNWQVTQSFAENGKSKTVVAFADGTLRTRQQVTKLKSTGDVVAGENIYDFQGRPAIATLPVPVNSHVLAYQPDMTIDESTNLPLRASDLEPTTGVIAVSPDKLATSAGASNYYSSQNHWLQNGDEEEKRMAKRIPDAEGYPYTQTVFMPDNTGRVLSQSSVGEEYKIGSSHATNYIYGIPDQAMLDRLFGSEVGHAEHYKLEAVNDANGQISITVKDLKDKVILTTLGGTKPANVQYIDGDDGTEINTYSVNLMNYNQIDVEDKSSTVNHLMAIVNPHTLPFTYSFDPQTYRDDCDGTAGDDICLECVYDLEISLTDLEGREYIKWTYPGNATPSISTLVGAISQNTSNCAAAPSFGVPATAGEWKTNDGTAALNDFELQPGNYMLSKKLVLNPEAISDYVNLISDPANNSCLRTWAEIEAEQDALMTDQPCGLTCEEIQIKIDDLNNIADPSEALQADILAYEAAQAERCNPSNSTCEHVYKLLLADVSPHGQYAKLLPGGETVDGEATTAPVGTPIQPWNFDLSVFNENNSLPKKGWQWDSFNTEFILEPNWKFPYIGSGANDQHYFTEDFDMLAISHQLNITGNTTAGSATAIAIVEIAAPVDGTYEELSIAANPSTDVYELDGQYFVEPQHLATIELFIAAWEDKWAESLVRYHPEYEYHTTCITLQPSEYFDNSMLVTDDNGDINIDATTTVTQASFVNDPTSVDPFFTHNSGSILTHFQNGALSNYPPNSFSAIEFDDILNNFYQQNTDGVPGMETYSIWEVAWIIANCQEEEECNACVPDPTSTIKSNMNQAEWEAFRILYRSTKREVIDRLNKWHAIEQGHFNGPIGGYSPNDLWTMYSSWFSNGEWWDNITYNPLSFDGEIVNVEQPGHWQTAELYTHKDKRYPTLQDGLAEFNGENEACYSTEPDEWGQIASCEEDNTAMGAAVENAVDAALAQNCGQCPLAFDLQMFLNDHIDPVGIGFNNDVSGDITCSGYSTDLVMAIADQCFGINDPYTNSISSTVSVVSNDEIEIIFSDGQFSKKLTLKIKGSDADTETDAYYYDLSDIKDFSGLVYSTNSYVDGSNPLTDGHFVAKSNVSLNWSNGLVNGISESGHEPDPWIFNEGLVNKEFWHGIPIAEGEFNGLPFPNLEHIECARQIEIEGYIEDLNIADCTQDEVCMERSDITADILLAHNHLLTVNTADYTALPLDHLYTAIIEELGQGSDPSTFHVERIGASPADWEGIAIYSSPTNHVCDIDFGTNQELTFAEYSIITSFNDIFLPDLNTPTTVKLKYVKTDNNIGYIKPNTCLTLTECTDVYEAMPDPSVDDMAFSGYYACQIYNSTYEIIDLVPVETLSGTSENVLVSYNSENCLVSVSINPDFGYDLNQIYTVAGSVVLDESLFTLDENSLNVSGNSNRVIVPVRMTDGSMVPITFELCQDAGYCVEQRGYACWIENQDVLLNYLNGLTGTQLGLVESSGLHAIVGETTLGTCNLVFEKPYGLYTSTSSSSSYTEPDYYSFANVAEFLSIEYISHPTTNLGAVPYFKISFAIDHDADGVPDGTYYCLAYSNCLNEPANCDCNTLLTKAQFDDYMDNTNNISGGFVALVSGVICGNNTIAGLSSLATGYNYYDICSETAPANKFIKVFYNSTLPDAERLNLIEDIEIGKTYELAFDYKFFDSQYGAGSYEVGLDVIYNGSSIFANTNTFAYNANGTYEGYFEPANTGILLSQIETTSGANLYDGNWHTLKVVFKANSNASMLSFVRQFNRHKHLIGYDNFSLKKVKCEDNLQITNCSPEVPCPMPIPDPCAELFESELTYNTNLIFEEELAQSIEEFLAKYATKCLENLNENFTTEKRDNSTYFTLYYYDQAGSLVKTIPPVGVKPLDQAGIDAVHSARMDDQNHTVTLPEHTMATVYRYNSLNQLMGQYMPDHDQFIIDGSGTDSDKKNFSSEFFYDKLGRLVASQNAKQYTEDPLKYSYTLYDDLGRVTESGEAILATALDNSSYLDYQAFHDLFYLNGAATSIAKSYVSKTYYDHATFSVPALVQENLNKRIAHTTMDEDGDGTYESASHYSYDIHGNVKTLVQDIPELNAAGHRYKFIDYEYDLVLGNVLQVNYQNNKIDAFYHKYEYDDDNRITNVYTSKDLMNWEQDAKYFYYKHGPLARTELGHNKVQALDYAYTLQGWLKGVNSDLLLPDNDQGQDAWQGGTTANNNQMVAADEYGYSLGYYSGDYSPIATVADPFLATTTAGSDIMMARNDLYNGNISHMVTSFLDRGIVNGNNTGDLLEQGTAYHYDQLNRIKSMEAFTNLDEANNNWLTGSNATQTASSYVYDKNGNITDLTRTKADGTVFDILDYDYTTDRNRLNYVDDSGTSGTDDLADQAAGNYTYDAQGNLLTDVLEDISISWTPSGKVKTVERGTPANGDDLAFHYDATGNRIIKNVHFEGLYGNTEYKKNYYILDAQGNIMAVYEKERTSDFTVPFCNDPGNCISGSSNMVDFFSLKERPIYGSSRLANIDEKRMYSEIYSIVPSVPEMPWSSGGILLYGEEEQGLNLRGQKFYELSNHLGNVGAVVSDYRIANDLSTPTNGLVDTYSADIISQNDYYPFGMLIPERQYASTKYRFGFNGMEKDDEMHGVTGSSYTTQFRQYDTRIAKWLSIDPLVMNFPWQSPYAAFDNNPIYYKDPKGAAASKPDGWENDNGDIVYAEDDLGGLGEGDTYTTKSGVVWTNIGKKTKSYWNDNKTQKFQKAKISFLEKKIAGQKKVIAEGNIIIKKITVPAFDIASDILPITGIPKGIYSLITGTNPVEDYADMAINGEENKYNSKEDETDKNLTKAGLASEYANQVVKNPDLIKVSPLFKRIPIIGWGFTGYGAYKTLDDTYGNEGEED